MRKHGKALGSGGSQRQAFKNDRPHGRGSYTYKNGDQHGLFKNGDEGKEISSTRPVHMKGNENGQTR